MKRRTALILGLGLLLIAGVLSLPYLMWRLVCWIVMDDEER
jgi:hypothetical protein